MWNNVNDLFPHNVIPQCFDLDCDSLKNSDIPEIKYRVKKMARDMIIRVEDWTWSSEGFCQEDTIYDVFGKYSNLHDKALTAYGARMVQDYLQNFNSPYGDCRCCD